MRIRSSLAGVVIAAGAVLASLGACAPSPARAPRAAPVASAAASVPLSSLPTQPPARVAIAGPEASPITFTRMAKYPEPGWNVPRRTQHSPDGKLVTYLASESGDETMSLYAFDRGTSKSEVLLRAADIARARGGSAANAPPAMSREEELRRERQRDRNEGITNYVWAKHAPVLVVPFDGDVFVRDARAGKTPEVRALTATAEPELDVKPCDTGERIAFVRKGELVAIDTTTGKEVFATRGAVEGLTHGLSDFNGQEEFGESSGFFWSPRCDRLVYLEVDERAVMTVPVLGYRKGVSDLMMERYPRVGTKNPVVRAGVVDLATKKTTWLRFPDASERYLGRFLWSEDGRALFLQTLSRDQKRLALVRVDPTSGATTELVTETSPAWSSFSPMRLIGGTESLLFTTAKTGRRHLEVRSARDGSVLRTLSSGAWDVESIAAVDEERGRVLVNGNKEGALERHVYAIPLGGGEPVRITRERGVHGASFDESGKRWVDLHSASDRLPRATVMDERDQGVAELPVRTDDDLAALQIRPAEHVTLESATGETLHGALLKPRVIAGKHPVIVMVYGGPGAQTVFDAYMPRLLWQHLADRGFVIFQLDNRGSGGHGPGFQHLVHRRLGELELADQVAGASWLASQPFVDPARIGIYGHSYGGFMAALAMLTPGTPFHAAVAGSPVTDWRLYDTAYTERYLETPDRNPGGYEASDLSKKAGALTGKLLLTHAMMDENVHFHHTAQLVDALVAANKAFELFVLPSERHGTRAPAARSYMPQRVATFFAENL